MKLLKKSEQVNRVYNEDGTYTDVVVSITYDVRNDNDTSVGSANANTNSVNMNVYSFKSIDEAKSYLEGLFQEVTE